MMRQDTGSGRERWLVGAQADHETFQPLLAEELRTPLGFEIGLQKRLFSHAFRRAFALRSRP